MTEASRNGERLVLLHAGALGDALLTFPALAWLRAARPDAHLTFVARGDVLGLARATGLADATFSHDAPELLALYGGVAPRPALRVLIEGARVVAWVRADDGLAGRLCDLGATEAFIAPPPTADDSGPPHAARRLAAALAPLAGPPPATVRELLATMPPLRIPEADEAAVRAFWASGTVASDAPVVALHPGSGSTRKRWSARHFAAVADGLSGRGYSALVIEGPADAEAVEAARRHADISVQRVRMASVGALAGVLRRCAGYLGNDSGVSHLAGLAGVPTLALFGPTDPEVWRPLGARAVALRAPGGRLDALTSEEVLSALLPLLHAATA